MPATNPRVNVVLERPVYEGLQRWAKRDGVSLSLKVRDLVREALERDEDAALARVAERRDRSFDRSHALSHEAVWGRARRSKRK